MYVFIYVFMYVFIYLCIYLFHSFAQNYGIIYIVEILSSIENQEVYQVTFLDFLACTCLGFIFIK